MNKISGWPAVDQRVISGTKRVFCSWLLTSVPTPFCLCKPFLCKACSEIIGRRLFSGRLEIISKSFQCYYKVISRELQYHFNAISKWFQGCLKFFFFFFFKFFQCHLEVILNLLKNKSKVSSIWFHDHLKIILKWFQCCFKVILKSFLNLFKAILKLFQGRFQIIATLFEILL